MSHGRRLEPSPITASRRMSANSSAPHAAAPTPLARPPAGLLVVACRLRSRELARPVPRSMVDTAGSPLPDPPRGLGRSTLHTVRGAKEATVPVLSEDALVPACRALAQECQLLVNGSPEGDPLLPTIAECWRLCRRAVS